MWPTFILDLANNHGGSVQGGLETIRAHAEVVKKYGVCAGVKFQLRDLQAYRHGDRTYGEYFQATYLAPEQIIEMAKEAKHLGFKVGLTPFDPSAANILSAYEWDFAKVASCCLRDRETLGAIVDKRLPTVLSTGGCAMDEIDNAATVAKNAEVDYALMHCVSLYPTTPDKCDLGRIADLKRFFPGRVIGWSSHEYQEARVGTAVAVALGAEIFEWHICLDRSNAYSLNAQQVGSRINVWEQATAVTATTGTLSEQRAALERVSRHAA